MTDGALRAAGYLLGALTLLGGCSTRENVWSDIARIPTSRPVALPGAAATVNLAPVASRLRKARGIGSYSRNVGCWVYVRQLTDADFPASPTLTAAAARAFEASQVRVSEAGRPADFRMRATILTARVDACNNSFFNAGPYEINAQFDVNWRVEDSNGVPVYDGSSSGVGHVSLPVMDITPAAEAAMTDAVTRLLQTAAVERALTRQPALVVPRPAPVQAPQSPGTLAFAPILITGLQPRTESGRLAAVTDHETKVTVGGRSGAGFYISKDGYLLTASANLGDVAIAPEAQLLRQDAALGVALLKSGGGTALPLRQQSLGRGEILMLAGGVIQIAAQPDAQGRFAVSNSAAPAGSPVLDSHDNVAGLIVTGPRGPLFVPIGLAFRKLNLGLALNND